MKKIDLTGQTFGRLTVVDRAPNKLTNNDPLQRQFIMWNCFCECNPNKIISISTSNLRNGNNKSCGCLKTQKKSLKLRQKIGDGGRQFDPRIASARRVWKSYGYNGDDNCTLTFDKFYELSQQNCIYCGIKPSNEYNCFYIKKGASDFAKQNGSFLYNGMDRIDNYLSHTDENCVPACLTCNRAKNNRTVEEFQNYSSKLIINTDTYIYMPENIILPSNRYIIQSIKSAYRTYHKEEITLEQFYHLSQLPCFYCGVEKSNKVNAPMTDKKSSQRAKDEGWFEYNGLDRINSNNIHTINNVVPCCYFCNFAKGKLTVIEFHDWIKRIQEYQKQKG